MAELIVKIPLKGIGVSRNGKSVQPEIGKPFGFTAEELEDLDRASEVTGDEYYRDPVNEEAPAKKSAGKKGGQPAAAAASTDEM